MRQLSQSVTWASGASMSSWTPFGGDAPNGLYLPVGWQGNAIAFFVPSRDGFGGADLSGYEPLDEASGGTAAQIVRAVRADAVAAFLPDGLRGHGYIAVQAMAGAVPQAQSAARVGRWFWASGWPTT